MSLDDYDDGTFTEVGRRGLKIQIDRIFIDFIKAKKETIIKNSTIYKSKIESLNLPSVKMVRSKIEDTKLLESHLGEVFFRKVSLAGSTLKNTILRRATLIRPDLSKADLRGADIKSSIIRSPDLSGTKLDDANLQNTKLVYTNATNCSITGSDLRGAEFHNVVFRDCNFENAKLGGESLLTPASFDNARLVDCDLSGVNVAVIGPENIDPTEATTLGTKLPESVSDYRRLGEAYREIERRSREKGVSRLYREAKFLRMKSEAKAALREISV